MVSGKLLMARPISVKDSNDDSKQILSGISDKTEILVKFKCVTLMKAGLESNLCKTMEGSMSRFTGLVSKIFSAKFSGRFTRSSIIGKRNNLRFFVCNIDDGSSFPPHFGKARNKLSTEENVTENSWRLMQSITLNSKRAGEQVLLERLFSDVHPAMNILVSFWRRKIDESTSSKLSQSPSITSFRFGKPDTFGHSISFLEELRSSISKFGKFCNNVKLVQLISTFS
jgi:hypothetical protein